MDCTLTGVYCGECGGRYEGRDSVDSKNAPSGIEEGEAPARSDWVVRHRKEGKEQSRCKLVCREKLHLTQCDWKQYLELWHQAEDHYSSVIGTLVS